MMKIHCSRIQVSTKIPANIYVYLKMNTRLACIKIRTEKLGIITYLSALVQLHNIGDQKPLEILKPNINRNGSSLYSSKILTVWVVVLQNYQIFQCSYLDLP